MPILFSVYMYNGVTAHSDTNLYFSVYMSGDVTANSDTNPHFSVYMNNGVTAHSDTDQLSSSYTAISCCLPSVNTYMRTRKHTVNQSFIC